MSPERVDAIVTGGLVVTSAGSTKTSISVNNGRVVALGAAELLPKAERTIDATGKYVLPGLIDAHNHFGGMEDLELAGRMAARAGLTTIIPFGVPDYNQREPMPDAVARHQDMADRLSTVDMAFHMMLGADPYILDGIPRAMTMGVKSFKAFMSYKSRRPGVMADDEFILRSMELIAAGDGVMQLHCENGDVIDYLEKKFRAEGRTNPRDYPDVAPPWVEEEAVNRAIELATMTECPLYVVHVSTHLGLERIKRAQSLGLPVWAETCPQYLLLCAEDHDKWGPLLKIGPPLRYRDDGNQEALWTGSRDGFVSCVASDHAPHPREEKELGWNDVFYQPDGKTPVPFGAPSIETLAQVTYSTGVEERGLGPDWLARVMSENPARVFGIYPRKGTIQVGSDADFTIIDPDARVTITAEDHLGKAGYTPYEGMNLKGAVSKTLLRGEVLMEDGEIKLGPEYGRFVACDAPVPPLGGRAG